MKICLTTLILGLALCCLVPSSWAQESGNRELHRIAVVPNPEPGGPGSIVVAIWTVDVELTSVPLDFGTEVELCLDGLPIQTITVPVMIDPGSGSGCQAAPPCSGDCGTGTVDGEAVTLICYEDCDPTGCECDCGVWIETEFDPLDITPGQEVKVLLKKLPSAVPDNESGDDGQAPPYERPIGWAREPEGVELTLVGEGEYDIRVPIQMEWSGIPGRLNLDTRVDLFVNSTLRSTQNIPAQAEQDVYQGCYVAGCTGGCGMFNGAPSFCDPLLWFDCACGESTEAYFPAEPLEPGDLLQVQLVPVPGALPELPGLDEDDEVLEVCCVPVAVGEVEVIGSARLDQNRPNPFAPSTTISFQIQMPGQTRIEVFGAGGTLVRTMLDRHLGSGNWSVTWDGRDGRGVSLPSGTYFYMLATPSGSETRRMTLLK